MSQKKKNKNKNMSGECGSLEASTRIDDVSSSAATASDDSLSNQHRFLRVLGTGAHGVVVMATTRSLEATATTPDGQLLFPGEHAPIAGHTSASRQEFELRHTGSDAQVAAQLDQWPLYVAIKRVDVEPVCRGQSTARDGSLFRTSRSLLTSLSSEAALLARYTAEAAVAVPVAVAVDLPKPLRLEIDLLLKLKHPNIVRLFGSFASSTQTFSHLHLITELVVGGDLALAISTLQLPRACNLRELYARRTITGVCHALAFMHSRGVAHRDVKPGNVLVGPPVKLCDLGLCTNGGDEMSLQVGTVSYMAPEMVLADGTQPYDASVDCWSMGVMTYELVSKDHDRPFVGATSSMLQQSILRHANTVPLSLSLLSMPNYHVSADCIAFTRALLSHASVRLSAVEALEHPWLSGRAAPSEPFRVLRRRHTSMVELGLTAKHLRRPSLPSILEENEDDAGE